MRVEFAKTFGRQKRIKPKQEAPRNLMMYCSILSSIMLCRMLIYYIILHPIMAYHMTYSNILDGITSCYTIRGAPIDPRSTELCCHASDAAGPVRWPAEKRGHGPVIVGSPSKEPRLLGVYLGLVSVIMSSLGNGMVPLETYHGSYTWRDRGLVSNFKHRLK